MLFASCLSCMFLKRIRQRRNLQRRTNRMNDELQLRMIAIHYYGHNKHWDRTNNVLRIRKLDSIDEIRHSNKQGSRLL